jgi:hypothetical protein
MGGHDSGGKQGSSRLHFVTDVSAREKRHHHLISHCNLRNFLGASGAHNKQTNKACK